MRGLLLLASVLLPLLARSPAPPSADAPSPSFGLVWGTVASGRGETGHTEAWEVTRTTDGAVLAGQRGLPAPGAPARAVVPDAQIASAVRRQLARIPELDARRVEVRVERGRVALRGSTADPSQAAATVLAALKTSGTRQVVSYLRWPVVAPNGH